MAKNKITPYILFGLPLAIGVYFVIKSMRDKKKGQVTDAGQQGILPIVTVPPRPTSVFPLKRGSKGDKVKELQRALLFFDKNLLPRFGADGDFGSETEAAVLKVLNKRTVDSQAEIDRILNMRPSQAGVSSLTPSANEIINRFKTNKSIKLQVIRNIQVVTGNYLPWNNTFARTGVAVPRSAGFIYEPTNIIIDQPTGQLYLINFANQFDLVNPTELRIL